MRSLLDQDYPGRLEVVAVDDRSTDRTGEIIAALRSAHVALARGGIERRGTFYPLRLLKGDTRSG